MKGAARRDHPRSRGEYRYAALGGFAERIIPALAGNTAIRQPGPGSSPDHPRSRGEYLLPHLRTRIDRGSSPLSRGIPAARDRREEASGIIPALAGNTLTSTTTSPVGRDHPRSRGEYARRRARNFHSCGSSPLSRGILCSRFQFLVQTRIIPALAGNTHGLNELLGASRDHPRSRGEYLSTLLAGAAMWGSSPLSRGIPVDPARRRGHVGIIPALAGNTPVGRCLGVEQWDHPRSRGEY